MREALDLDRTGIRWRLDPRLAEDEQTGDKVYARNDIDCGHLVCRASAVWGDTRAEAAQANEDTFHYTNAAPQAAKFNQGLDLWPGMESYLLDNAADHGRRLIVFPGCVFSDVDPVCRGVEIPLQFFKVDAFLHDGVLAATGYIVDQTPQLADLSDVPRASPGTLRRGPGRLPVHGLPEDRVLACLKASQRRSETQTFSGNQSLGQVKVSINPSAVPFRTQS